jgi:multiple sugar transport system substrate-binding protein
MFDRSRHKHEVWQLIRFLSQPSQQRRFHALSGDLPPRRSAWNDAGLANDPHAAAFRDQLERVRAAPKVPEWERIAQEIRIAAERAVRRSATEDEALAYLDARADTILEKRRWMLEQRHVEKKRCDCRSFSRLRKECPPRTRSGVPAGG